MSRALDSDKSGISYGEQHTARPLLTPDEVRNLPQHVELLFLAGQRRSSPASSPIMPMQSSGGCMTLPDVTRSGPGA
jgi:type IV secretory pathway TraG/TraD family ATPase VirD4